MKYLVAIDVWDSKITVNGEVLAIKESNALVINPSYLELVLDDGTEIRFEKGINTDIFSGFIGLLD